MEFHSSANSLSEAEDATPFDELSAGKPSHSGLDTETPYDHVVKMMSRHSTFDGSRPEHQGEDGDDQMDPEVISKVETLARTLSHHRFRDGPLEIDPKDFDAAAILSTFVRASEEQGIHLRKSGVVAEDISAKGVDSRFSEGETFGDILMLPKTIFRGIQASRQKKLRNIIQDVNLLARPGEMISVLGRPGAGCSSLLKTASGEIDQFSEVTGQVSYDSITQKEMMKR